jgi:hypothetical protein
MNSNERTDIVYTLNRYHGLPSFRGQFKYPFEENYVDSLKTGNSKMSACLHRIEAYETACDDIIHHFRCKDVSYRESNFDSNNPDKHKLSNLLVQ